ERLQTPIDYLKGVGPARADLLRQELGIHTFQDLLNLFPNRYIDKTRYYKINELQHNSAEVQVVGKITHLKTVGQKRGKRLVATFVDDTGQMELVWFRGHKWIKDKLKIKVPYIVFGKLNWYGRNCSIAHPEMELLEEHKKSIRMAMQPIYPSTEKLGKKNLSNTAIIKMMKQVFLECKTSFFETLSPDLLQELKLMPRHEAVFNIHFPQSQNKLSKAEYRLKFEELFYIQLQLIRKNQLHKQKIKGFPFERIGAYFN